MLKFNAELSPRPLAIAFLFLIAAAACGGGGTSPSPVVSVTIGPSSPSVVIGGTQQLTASTRDAAGAELTGRTVTWSSNSPSIATVSIAGLVSGLALGTATITATSETVIGTATFTVLPIPAATVTVTPNLPIVQAGQTVQLTAVVKDANGNTLTGRTVTWSSSNPVAATVSSTGLVTGSSVGSATISATNGTTIGMATVTVTSPTRVLTYEYYKRGGTATPATATLTLPNGYSTGDTLRIDGQTITGISTVVSPTSAGNGSGVDCFSNPAGSVITSCASHGSPHTIRLCGPNGVLLYVLFDSPDANRIANTSTALLAAVQSDTRYLGIPVFPDCGTIGPTSWIRNYPNTNYYLWPNVIATYTPAYVSGLLTGAVIYSTPAPGTDYHQFAAVRVSSTVFELWH